MFSKGYFLRVVKNQNCDKRVIPLQHHPPGPKIFRKGTRPAVKKVLSKGTCPALISTRQFSNQFILKESQNTDFFAPILVDY